MSDHVCPHEQTLGKINATLKKLDRDLYGNGQKGIVERFVKVEIEMESVEKLATAFSALAKSDSNKEAVRRAMADGLKNTGKFIAMGATIIGVLYLILDHVG